MRPVNLLPATDRPTRPVDAGKGSYILLGVLGALLVAVLATVVSQNQINSRKTEIARATQETQEAEQRVARLGAFGEFATVKEMRLQSVRGLAQARFDWERLVRELALVLPEDTWVTAVNASASGTTDGESSTAPSSSGAAAPTTSATGGPAAKIMGCASSPSEVARVMVRLRNLHRAEDVQLTESSRADAEGSSGSAAGGGGATAGTEPTAGAEGCGDNYSFDTSVSFSAAPDPAAEAESGGVPAALGGGS